LNKGSFASRGWGESSAQRPQVGRPLSAAPIPSRNPGDSLVHAAVTFSSSQGHPAGLRSRIHHPAVTTLRLLTPTPDFTYAASEDTPWRRRVIHGIEQLTGKPRLRRLYA